jgi:hypothetical protein
VHAQISVGLSLMIEPDFLQATLPLFEQDQVDLLEWSVDLGWGPSGVPAWAAGLLDEFGQRGRLHAHGVHFSTLSTPWQPRQERWLARLAGETRAGRYRSLSEHFGFSTLPGIRHGAPFPVPFCAGAVEIGRERLALLADAAAVPVGLENLALAWGERDVWSQGPFLDQLLRPLGGFLLLDVHNLHCQIENFGCDVGELLGSYPLDLARTIHVSGGSWAEPRHGRIRQDTHDDAVPDEVFALVSEAIARCPNVEAVVFERLGGTIRDEPRAARLRADYERLRRVVREASPTQGARASHPGTGSASPTFAPTAHGKDALAAYEAALLDALCAGEEPATRFATQLGDWSDVTRDYEGRMLALGARIANSYTVRQAEG